MDSASSALVLVAVCGPQASGKSALASALASELRQDGELVALIELDQIAAMALPTLPSWEDAHRIFEATTALWARTELTCVIAEGSGTREEVAGLLAQAPQTAATVTVVTTVAFDTAFARAQADPTRGVSKERSFLSGVYERWRTEVDQIDTDVLIDTGALSLAEGVERVRAAIVSARGESR